MKCIILYPLGFHVSFTAKRNFADSFGLGGGFVAFISTKLLLTKRKKQITTTENILLQTIFVRTKWKNNYYAEFSLYISGVIEFDFLLW